MCPDPINAHPRHSGALPPPENRVYFPALDGLRTIALAMVFLAHYAGIAIFGVGVNVFFVLSGFLITGILLDTTASPHRVRTFYVRRALRIFPLYYGVFLALLGLTPILHFAWTSAWLLWPVYLGNLLPYMHPWLPPALWTLASDGQLPSPGHHSLLLGHFWSLCLEEQFYFLWPYLVFHLSRRHLLWLCSSVVLLLPVVRVIASHTLSPTSLESNILFRTLPFQADSMLLGALVALVWRGSHRHFFDQCAGIMAPLLSALAFVVIVVHYKLPFHWLPQPYAVNATFLTWQLSFVNLVSAAVIINALRPRSLFFRLLSRRSLSSIGRISYGAYVFHDIPHQLYAGLAARLAPTHVRVTTGLFALVGTLILASISFYLLERPFLLLKSRWAKP